MRISFRPLLTVAASLLTVVAAQTLAHADYIWATIEGDQAKFALMDYAGSTPNPQYASYVAGIDPRLNGKALPPGTPKNGALYTPLPARTSKTVVTAEKIVGVRERDGETYLLVYDAKGAASLEAAKTVIKAPAEIVAISAKGMLTITVLQDGTPVPESEVWVQWDSDQDATPVKTNAKGMVQIPWGQAAGRHGGFVCIRAKVKQVKSGEMDGKKYPAIRRWATLAFPLLEKS